MEKEIYIGKFIANARGFGFVEVEDLETDIFIGEMDVKTAMHGDTVEVRIRTFRGGKRPEGVIVKIEKIKGVKLIVESAKTTG